MKRILLTALMTLISCSVLAGEIYSWKDKDGRTHYSDRPPADNKIQIKSGKSAPAPATAASASSLAEKNRAFKERSAAKADAEQKSAEDKKRDDAKRQYCAELKQRLETFESGIRVTHVVGGENVYYTDEERSALSRKARADLAEAKCGK